MIKRSLLFKFILAIFIGGFGMWIIAGLWHNLILPTFNENSVAHHDGLFLMLIAYFILSFLMTYIFLISKKSSKTIIDGLKIGIIIGVLWVFPHGLTMAGAHNTSFIYEIQNMLWHVFEQGIGGIIIAFIIGKSEN